MKLAFQIILVIHINNFSLRESRELQQEDGKDNSYRQSKLSGKNKNSDETVN